MHEPDSPVLRTGIYRHYKGRFYFVYGISQDSESEQRYAVYRPLYGDMKLWVRPLEMFCERLSEPALLRFELVEEAEPGGLHEPTQLRNRFPSYCH